MKQNAFFSKQNRAVKVLLVLMAIWMLWFIGSAIVGQVRDVFVRSEEIHYQGLRQSLRQRRKGPLESFSVWCVGE